MRLVTLALFLLTSALVLFKALIPHLRTQASRFGFKSNRMFPGKRPSKLATWCKGEEAFWYFNSAVRQSVWEKSRKLHPGQIFLFLHTVFLHFRQTWRSLRTGHHRIRPRGCIKPMFVGLAPGLSSTTLGSLRCLHWTFEFSQPCFSAIRVLVLFAGENKHGSSPSKEVFKALHGHNFSWVQDVC